MIQNISYSKLYISYLVAVSLFTFGCKEIPPEPPQADFVYTPEHDGTTDSIFVFDATLSSDINDDTEQLKIRWDYNDDGEWDTDWTANKIASYKFGSGDFDASGRCNVGLIVIDLDGMTNSVVKSINVKITEPKGNISISPTEGDQLTTFYINAMNYKDAFGNDSIKIRWDFGGDGTWSDWKWKNSEDEYLGFEFSISGLSFDGTYKIKAEIQDYLGNASSESINLELTKLVVYEIINVEENQVFSGNNSLVQVRIIKPYLAYEHQLYIDDKFHPISSIVNQPDKETHIIELELHSDNYADGIYQLFAKCFYLAGNTWIEEYDSPEIPIVLDNGGLSILSISSPNETSVWAPNSTESIIWSPVAENTRVNVHLLGVTDNSFWRWLATDIENTGSLTYTVEDDLPSGTYKIYVNVTPETGIGKGFSDDFLISNPEPLEIIADYGPFNNIADVDFINGSEYFYALCETDPIIFKIFGEDVISQIEFWENATGVMPKYGGYSIDGNSEDSDFFVARSSTGNGDDYPCIVKYSGSNPSNILAYKRYENLSGIVYKFSDMCIAGGYLYLLDTWNGKVWKVDKATLNKVADYDVNDVRNASGDKLFGIAYDGSNFWITLSNFYSGGSATPQVVKLSSSFSILARYDIPNGLNPTGIEYNMNNGNLYMTTPSYIYKLAKE